jgi:hypothetical protein
MGACGCGSEHSANGRLTATTSQNLLLAGDPNPVEIKQPFYPMVALGRQICQRCNDGYHFKKCLGFDCQCPCRDSVPQPKVVRDRNGLTEEERRNQVDFPFDKHQPLEVK